MSNEPVKVPRRRIKKNRRSVDIWNHPDDHECALLAAVGRSTYAIAKATGLSPSQISYRLKVAGMTLENGASRTDYRNGTSPFADIMMKVARPSVDKGLYQHLQAHAPQFTG